MTFDEWYDDVYGPPPSETIAALDYARLRTHARRAWEASRRHLLDERGYVRKVSP